MGDLNLQALKTKDVQAKTVGANVANTLLPIVGAYAMQAGLILVLL